MNQIFFGNLIIVKIKNSNVNDIDGAVNMGTDLIQCVYILIHPKTEVFNINLMIQ